MKKHTLYFLLSTLLFAFIFITVPFSVDAIQAPPDSVKYRGANPVSHQDLFQAIRDRQRLHRQTVEENILSNRRPTNLERPTINTNFNFYIPLERIVKMMLAKIERLTAIAERIENRTDQAADEGYDVDQVYRNIEKAYEHITATQNFIEQVNEYDGLNEQGTYDRSEILKIKELLRKAHQEIHNALKTLSHSVRLLKSIINQ